MKISTEIGSASLLVGEEKAVEYVAKAGFAAWDFSMFAMCDYDWSRKMLKLTGNCCLRNIGKLSGAFGRSE